MHVELKAAFSGATWLPSWIALSSSNLSPHLILGDDGIDYKVVRSGSRRYDEVAAVDFRRGWGTRNISLRFKTTGRTFTGNVVDDDMARRALAFLRTRNCPLTARALAFLDAS